MLQVKKIAEIENMGFRKAPIACANCGMPEFEDVDMKKICFGNDANSVCLCSSCTKHLQSILGLII